MKKNDSRVKFCRAAALSVSACLFLSGCGTNSWFSPIQEEEVAGDQVQVQIEYDASKNKTTSQVVTLYFISEEDPSRLVAEQRTLVYEEDRRMEEVLLSELIKGPSAEETQMLPVLDPKTRTVSITGDTVSGDTLYITLSSEFLSTPPAYSQQHLNDEVLLNQYRQMTVKAIVNTLTELGQYSKIDFQVQNGDSVRRLLNSEAGITNNPENAMAPAQRDADRIVTPRNALSIVLSMMRDKSWRSPLGAYLYLDTDNKDVDAAYAALATQTVQVEDFIIGDVVMNASGDRAVVTLDQLLLRDKSGSIRYMKDSVPICAYLSDGIWKISYTRLNSIMTLQ